MSNTAKQLRFGSIARRATLAALTASLLLASSLTMRPAFADDLDQFLDSAERSMQNSADSLRSKKSDQSVDHQSSAIRDLEKYLQNDQKSGSGGDLQQDQQALLDRLKKLQEQLGKQGQQGQQGEQAEQGDGDGDELDQAGSAMGDAGSQLGEGDSEGAVGSQGKALEAMRNGQKKLAESMQKGDGEGDQAGDGPGETTGRRMPGNPNTDPLGRPLSPHDVDDFSQKIPGEIDVQRVRRILEELRRRAADPNRSQTELDYIERLLKDF